MQHTDREFQKQFIKKSQIGRGTFGEVYKCICNKTGQLCAVKIICNVTLINIEKIEGEVKIMQKIASDYSLELLDSFYNSQTRQFILVMPYCRKGSLEKKMKENWDLNSLLLFLIQITEGFIEFSQRQVLHLDLKPENILIKNTEEYLICDFGCSKVYQSLAQSINYLQMSLSQGIGTPDYMAPEVKDHNKANKYSDVWSLGVILYKIIYHSHPFQKTEGFGAYKTKYYGHKAQIQPIIPLLQSMLSVNNRIKWTDLKIKIYEILKIPLYMKIVTSMTEYVQYVKNIAILGTCLMHYIERVQRNLQKCNISPKNLIKNFLLYIYEVTIMTVNSDEYYFFESTKSRIKVEQKTQLLSINKQIKKILDDKNIQNDDDINLLGRKKKLLIQSKMFYQGISQLRAKVKEYFYKMQQLEYFKVVKIMQFLNQNQDNLHYKQKRALQKFVYYLIHA